MSFRFDVHTSLRTFLFLAGGVYLLLVVMVAILPAAALQERYPPLAPVMPAVDPELDPVEQGRRLYLRYGCVYCHTQQIRGDERLAVEEEDGTLRVPVLGADARFGLDRPSTAEEYRDDRPPFMGTQRTGPDLLAVGTRLPSATWHYWHLYDPRSVSPDSTMQGLPWLFATESTRQEGVTYEKVDPLFDLDVEKGRIYATPEAQYLVEYLLSRTRPESTR